MSEPIFQVDQQQLKRIVSLSRVIPTALRNKIIRQETRAAAKLVLLPAAKQTIPVRTGKLRKSIKIRAIKRSRVNSGVRLALSGEGFTGDAFYGGFIEYGFRPGRRPGKGKADTRRKVAGRETLRDVARRHGLRAANMAAENMVLRIETEIRAL